MTRTTRRDFLSRIGLAAGAVAVAPALVDGEAGIDTDRAAEKPEQAEPQDWPTTTSGYLAIDGVQSSPTFTLTVNKRALDAAVDEYTVARPWTVTYT